MVEITHREGRTGGRGERRGGEEEGIEEEGERMNGKG
jgi:hypothetical protein